MVKQAIEIATSPQRFTAQRQQEVMDTLGSTLHRKLTYSILLIEGGLLWRERLIEIQKQQKGFLAGDWFKCPLGHIFHARKLRGQSGKTAAKESTPSCPSCDQKVGLLFDLKLKIAV